MLNNKVHEKVHLSFIVKGYWKRSISFSTSDSSYNDFVTNFTKLYFD